MTRGAVFLTALFLAGSCLVSRPAVAASEVFSGWIVSTDRNRYRMRVRTPDGERRAVWMQVENVWRSGELVGRKVLHKGQRVLVTAKRGKREWKATRVQVM
jgi:hypothetical protein